MKTFTKSSDIKVGVIGYGGAFNMGKAHLNEMKAAGMVPVAVADTDPKRAAIAKDDFKGIATFTNVKDMLKKSDVNLVTIITPHNTHAPLALACLQAGKHVVCEKPLAITTAECDAMISMAKKNNCMLSTYHNRHWDGCIMQAVKTLKTGVIGDIARIEAHMGWWGNPGNWWRTSKTISGGILYDWGVHLLEYMFQLVKGQMVEVSGYSRSGYWAPKTIWKKDANEDDASAIVRLDNGSWISLTMSNIESKPKEGQIEVTGTKGSYVFDGSNWTLITHDANNNTVTTRGRNPQSEGWRFYKNIAGHLTKGEKLVITPEWARRPIHVLDLAVQSAKKGRALPVKYQ